jgi:hypothetical protein
MSCPVVACSVLFLFAVAEDLFAGPRLRDLAIDKKNRRSLRSTKSDNEATACISPVPQVKL